MNIAFPYRYDGRGRTAEVDDDRHVRDLIKQLLFTAPGERVNRPTFGCGLAHLVLEPLSDELATATQSLGQCGDRAYTRNRHQTTADGIDPH